MTTMTKTHHRTRLNLTDEEWMSIIVADRGGLPACCANVSTLRDALILIARNDGEVSAFNNVEQRIGWVFPDHDEPSPVMLKVMEQLGITLPVNDDGHQPQAPEHT